MKWTHLKFGSYSGMVDDYRIEIGKYVCMDRYRVSVYRFSDQSIDLNINIQEILDEFFVGGLGL